MAIVVLSMTSAIATAQTSSFYPVGEVPASDKSKKERLESAMEEARWSFGNTRIAPFIGLTDSGWIRDAFDGADRERVDDFTATVAAGLSLFHAIGNDAVFSLWARPEYVWWNELEDRRRLNGVYGLGWYAYFTRLRAELEASREDRQALTTPEVRELTSQREDAIDASFAIDLYRSLALSFGATTREYESLLEVGDLGAGADFARLDRQEDVLQLGLEMRLKDLVELSFGVFVVETDFSELTRDNEGDGIYVGVLLDRDRIHWDSRIEQRRLEATSLNPLAFPDFDEVLGFSSLTLRSSGGQREYGLHGRRSQLYSLGSEFAYLLEQTLGVWWSTRLGSRHQLRLYVEASELDFEPVSAGSGQRSDDIERYGVNFTRQFADFAELRLGWRRETVTSTPIVPDLQDRDSSAIIVGLNLTKARWP